MKHAARFVLPGIVIATIYFLWQKPSQPANRNPTQPDRASPIVSSLVTNGSISTEISSSTLQAAPAQRVSSPLADCLATLSAKLRQWRDSQLHDPDDEEGRKQLLAE